MQVNMLDPGHKAYVLAVEAFMQREGLNCLTSYPEDSPDYSPDPFFSWRPCECCHQLAGGRENACGWNADLGEVCGPYEVCLDCLYYHANGELPDCFTYQVMRGD